MRTRLQTHRHTGLVALLFAVFTTVLGVGMAVPLLPLYAHHLGATGVRIGMLSGAFSFSRLVCAPWFGRRSDRNERRRWIVGGLLLHAVISILLGQIRNLDLLVAARALHGVAGAMLIPLMQACAGELAPRGSEGKWMGIYGAVVLAGLGLGPIVGGLVSDRMGFGAAFIATGVLTAIGAAVCARWLPRLEHERHTHTQAHPAPWRTILGDARFAGLVVFRFCQVVCVGVVWAFLPLYMSAAATLGNAAVGVVVGIGIVVSGLLNVPMGSLADRVDPRRIILAGGLIAASAMVSIASAHTLLAFAMASACFGIGGGMATPAAMAMAARHGQRTASMGTTMAVMTSVHGAGMMAGAMLGGLVLDHGTTGGVFLFGATVLLAGTLAFVALGAARGRRARNLSLPEAAHSSLTIPARAS